MARKRVSRTRTKSYTRTKEYIDGTTIRREQVVIPVPKPEPKIKTSPERQKSLEFQRRLAEERKKAKPYTIQQKVMVAVAIGIVIIGSIFYLLSESLVANHMNELKKKKIAVLPVENLSMVREINIAYQADFSQTDVLHDIVNSYHETLRYYR